jgi:hypothetical protein
MKAQIKFKKLNIMIVLLFIAVSIILPSQAIAEDPSPAVDSVPTTDPAPAEVPASTENPSPATDPIPTEGAAVEAPVVSADPLVTEPAPDTIRPSITVNSISLQSDGVVVKGFVSDNQAIDQPIVMKVIYPDATEEVLTPISGSWSFKTDVSTKLNKLKIQATDASNNTTEIPAQRPYIKSITMSVFKYKEKVYKEDGSYQDEDVTADIDILKHEGITRATLNQTIKIELSDLLSHSIVNPFIVYDKQQQPVPIANIKFDSPNNIIELTLNDLNQGETYWLKFNTSLISTGQPNESTLLDDGGLNFYPVIKKFTTVSNAVKSYSINGYKMVEMDNLEKQPHGYYNNNVNNCTICHNTHVGSSSSLEGKDLAENYCMACHDGTAAPKMENADSDIKSKHETQAITEHQTKSGSCTACHNPHLTWSEDNQNLLKDHYVYEHPSSDEWEGKPVGEIDSSIQLCESCHGRYTYSYKQRAEEAGAYKVLHYQKESSAIGQITTTDQVKDGITTKISHVEDYNLCFNCHNSEKQEQTNNKTKDILSYYTNSDSKHFISAINGNSLNGQIPCAECHETHGAKNIFLLKDKLGHENQQDFSLAKVDDWTDIKKRDFCLTCHNGKTSIYGVTGKAIYDENGVSLNSTNESVKSGHARDSAEVCSACHSNNNSFIEAVHGPVTINTP